MPSPDIVPSVSDTNLKVIGDVPAWTTSLLQQFTAQSSGQAMENAVISNNITNTIATTSAGILVNQMQVMASQMNNLIAEMGTNKAMLTNTIGLGQSALNDAISLGQSGLNSTILANKNTLAGVEGDAMALLGMIASFIAAVEEVGIGADAAVGIVVTIAEVVIQFLKTLAG